MNYVKSFKINGVDTTQVACIELQGAPNAATEGAVGVLGMDMTSLTHDVYRCVAVNGSIYTWELLSAGLSIIPATITGEGGEQKSFPYTTLLIPERYLIKSGDLIIDSEGYLYQIKSIGASSCDASYVGTHIGSAGAKTYKLVVNNGKLQLVTESGAVLSSVDHMVSDELTLYRDSTTGVVQARGINTVNEIPLRFFVGTRAEYEALLNKSDLFAIITDDNTKDNIITAINKLQEGFDSCLHNGAYTEGAKSGDPIQGVLIHCDEEKGTYYHVSWETNTIIYDFGIVRWNGQKKLYSPVSIPRTPLNFPYHLALVIEPNGYAAFNQAVGKARIKQWDETGTESDITLTGTTLYVTPLTDTPRME